MLKTARLSIVPLSQADLELYLMPGVEFEKSRGLVLHPREVSRDLWDMIELFTLPKLAAEPGQAMFLLPWVAIDADTRHLVADGGFKGGPNARGEIEIGYATMADFQNKGYATELVGGLVRWAARQKGVKAILADTDWDNLASQTVLQKNGFEFTHAVNDIYWWRLNLKR